jgi:hypothetical protein
MKRLIAIFLAGLAVVGILEAISFGKQAELHVYHLSVSPGGNELLREPLHEVQPVTLRADAGDSLAIELDLTESRSGAFSPSSAATAGQRCGCSTTRYLVRASAQQAYRADGNARSSGE